MLDQAHIHLLTNHFPITGFIFAALLLAVGLLRKNESYQRAALMILVVAGVLGGVAFYTGEGAEHILENYPNFSKDSVHEHEEAAEFAIWSIGITAVTAAAGLFFKHKRIVHAVLALTVFSLVVIGRTNNLGGRISHPEVRPSEQISE